MAKVADHEADVLYQGDWLTIRAMRARNGRLPAKEWLDGLQKAHQAKFLAAAEVIETTLRIKRPPAGRLEPIKGSSQGLSELRITPKGKKGGPHLRMACLRQRRTLWVAHGFTKQSNALDRRDINAADSVAEQWRAQR